MFTTTNNPLMWNSIFNVWFDANVGPSGDDVTLGQFQSGAGSPTFTVQAQTPTGELAGRFCFGDGGILPNCTNCPCGNNTPPGLGGRLLQRVVPVLPARPARHSERPQRHPRFDILGANPNTFGVLVSADNRLPNAGACPPGAGIQSVVLDGLRCVGGNLKRHGTRATDANGANTNPWGRRADRWVASPSRGDSPRGRYATSSASTARTRRRPAERARHEQRRVGDVHSLIPTLD